MSNIKYDPELPFAFVLEGDSRVYARFLYRDDANFFRADMKDGAVVDTTPKPKIPEDAQHITWGTGDVAYSRYHDGRWYGWTDCNGLSDEELLKKIGNAEVTVLVRKEET